MRSPEQREEGDAETPNDSLVRLNPGFIKLTKIAEMHCTHPDFPPAHADAYRAVIGLTDNRHVSITARGVANKLGKGLGTTRKILADLVAWGLLAKDLNGTRGMSDSKGVFYVVVGQDGCWPRSLVSEDGKSACLDYLAKRPPYSLRANAKRPSHQKRRTLAIDTETPGHQIHPPGHQPETPWSSDNHPPRSSDNHPPRSSGGQGPWSSDNHPLQEGSQDLTRSSSRSAPREEELEKRIKELELENAQLRARLGEPRESLPGVPPGRLSCLKVEWDRVHDACSVPRAEDVSGAVRAVTKQHSVSPLEAVEALLSASEWQFQPGTRSPLGSAVKSPRLFGGGGERRAKNYDAFEPAPSDGEVYVPSGEELSELAKKCGW